MATKKEMSKEEWGKRVDLAAAYRLMDLYGMTELSANHISTRVAGEDNAFLINPYGLPYDQMHASCFIKLDLDGNILFYPTDLGINKAGFVIHGAIHGARHDVDCVIHTHTIAGMAVSAMKCGLLPIAQTSMRFAKIGYHDYEGVAINKEERASLVRDLGNVELQMPPDEVVNESYRMYLPTTRRPFGVLEWPALLAKLDKLDPSYRD